jgi:lysophospholipase L1-like esterase
MMRASALLLVMTMVVTMRGSAWAQTQTPPGAVPPPAVSPPPVDCPEMGRALRDLINQDGRMRDWPQLARYRALNAEWIGSGAAVDVVFFGDSITDSWDNERFSTWFPGKRYVNRGISGQTTPQMLVRLTPDVLALKPKVIVLLAGTNDIAGNTGPVSNQDVENNIIAISELAGAHGVKMVLSSVLPVSNYHVKPELGPPQVVKRPMERITVLNSWLKQYAAAHGHGYIDYFSAMTDAQGLLRSELSADDLHPNRAGYEIMAPLAEAAIAEALGRP